MSWTPTFLVSKEEFDANYHKIRGKIQDYESRKNSFYSSREEMIKKEYKRLCDNASELGMRFDEKDIKNRAEKIVEESVEFKKLVKNFDNENQPLHSILEYYEEEHFYEVSGKKYYIFRAEFSTEAYALQEFLDENLIPYSTGGGE